MSINSRKQTIIALPSNMRERAMMDFKTLDEYLLPNTQEMMEISPYEAYDYLQDIPAFRDAVEEVLMHRSGDDDMNAHPSIYGA